MEDMVVIVVEEASTEEVVGREEGSLAVVEEGAVGKGSKRHWSYNLASLKKITLLINDDTF